MFVLHRELRVEAAHQGVRLGWSDGEGLPAGGRLDGQLASPRVARPDSQLSGRFHDLMAVEPAQGRTDLVSRVVTLLSSIADRPSMQLACYLGTYVLTRCLATLDNWTPLPSPDIWSDDSRAPRTPACTHAYASAPHRPASHAAPPV